MELNHIDACEVEAELCASILRGADLPDGIAAESFYWQCYGWLWDAAKSIKAQGGTADAVTVGDELARLGKLDDFQAHKGAGWQGEGRAALSRLRERGDKRAAAEYAERVADYATKRQLVQFANQLAGWALNGRRANDIIQDGANYFAKIQPTMGNLKTVNIADAVTDARMETYRAAGGELVSVPTGYYDYDNLLGGGWSKKELIVIAARPGVGKTAFIASAALNQAQAGKSVLIFSLEMGSAQIARRMIAMLSGVSYDKQQKGKMSKEEWDAFEAGADLLASLPIHLNDIPSITVPQVKRELSAIHAQTPIDIMYLDYIQIASAADKHDRRDLEIGEITSGLKGISKIYDIPVVACAQMSRAIEGRSKDDQVPQLSDLRESGSIENDSDKVTFIYGNVDMKSRKLKTAKNRNGKVGTVELYFDGERTRFENPTKLDLNHWADEK